jgi:hypothetical protein
VLDIKDLHEKDLEFDVSIQHLKLRELSSAVSNRSLLQQVSCFFVVVYYRWIVFWRFASITVKSLPSALMSPSLQTMFM